MRGMYKIVQNEVDQALFNGIWTTVWHESGYELEFSQDVLACNIVYNEDNQAIGCAEIKPYYLDLRSSINKYAPFLEHSFVKQAAGNIGECDKVALLKSFRGKGIYTNWLLTSICISAQKNNLTAIVSLLEPMFMRALKRYYKVPIEEVSSPFFYKGDYVVPVVMDVGYINAHRKQFNWFMINADK